MIKLIVAVDSNYGIGYRNSLLFRVKEDLQRFRELTTGHFVIMGRKTYESLPKALPERINVVITRNTGFQPKESTVIVENNIHKLINHYLDTGQQDKDLWIIGGEAIYKEFLPYVDKIYLTKIHKEAEKVDTYFPMGKTLKNFQLQKTERAYSEKEECEITFAVYQRVPS